MTMYVLLLAAIVAWTEATIPIYDMCNGTITLDYYQPAVRIHNIGIAAYTDERDCLIHVKQHTMFDRIGVVLLDYPTPMYPSECHVLDGADAFRYQYQFTLNYYDNHKKYCAKYPTYGFNTKETIRDLNIQAVSIDVAWKRGGPFPSQGFAIVVFLYSTKSYMCNGDKTPCAGSENRRCIPTSIICDYPFKFCGDGSYLCPSYLTTTSLTSATRPRRTTSRSTAHTHAYTYSNTNWESNNDSGITKSSTLSTGAIIAIIACICVFVVLCLCFACRMCTSKASNTDTERQRQGFVSPIQMTPRDPPMRMPRMNISSILVTERSSNVEGVNRMGVPATNAGFRSDPPPVYESLDTTNADAHAHAHADDADGLPPSYEAVVSNVEKYQVPASMV